VAYVRRMDGVGWMGTLMIFAPVLVAVLVAGLITAVAMRREKSKRRKD
jgi:flagellar biosynthesis protein FliQ